MKQDDKHILFNPERCFESLIKAKTVDAWRKLYSDDLSNLESSLATLELNESQVNDSQISDIVAKLRQLLGDDGIAKFEIDKALLESSLTHLSSKQNITLMEIQGLQEEIAVLEDLELVASKELDTSRLKHNDLKNAIALYEAEKRDLESTSKVYSSDLPILQNDVSKLRVEIQRFPLEKKETIELHEMLKIERDKANADLVEAKNDLKASRSELKDLLDQLSDASGLLENHSQSVEEAKISLMERRSEIKVQKAKEADLDKHLAEIMLDGEERTNLSMINLKFKKSIVELSQTADLAGMKVFIDKNMKIQESLDKQSLEHLDKIMHVVDQADKVAMLKDEFEFDREKIAIRLENMEAKYLSQIAVNVDTTQASLDEIKEAIDLANKKFSELDDFFKESDLSEIRD